MSRLAAAAAALRNFLRGFAGLPAAPTGGANDARRSLELAAKHRGRCC